ncbi:MAG: UDP-N-acetylmuramoyl-L-alanyl-D-glutamate--2,6-diaminopimelate ligase [Bacteroidales bacterium]
MTKHLQEITGGIEILELRGPENPEVTGICFDSRICRPGEVFVAVKGTLTDGHRFIGNALERGAAVIVHSDPLQEPAAGPVTRIRVNDTAKALGLLASAFFGYPSRYLNLIGVTGTNGKTTTVHLLRNIAEELGDKAGMLSTVENRIGDKRIGATHTTPDPVQINRLLAEMVAEGCTWCFMEVSSHAIDQQRIAGLTFRGAIFTNLTHDHLDYHKTFDAYLNAKKRFFDQLNPDAFALTNIDDRNGKVMLQNCRANQYSYALKKPADFKGRIIEDHPGGLHLEINGTDVWTRLTGSFNAYNLLAAAAAMIITTGNEEEVFRALSNVKGAPGRFQTITGESGITCVIDYAHTPDALKNILNSLRHYRKPGNSIITVTGAGGNRDKAKRPVMAAIAAQESDKLILTSDNPRDEEPEAILNDMLEGIAAEERSKVLSITDRREAIKTAFWLAKPGDLILIAGKGHEKYQEIKGVRHPFDDLEEAQKYLKIKTVQN